jgi:hypothetical protein
MPRGGSCEGVAGGEMGAGDQMVPNGGGVRRRVAAPRKPGMIHHRFYCGARTAEVGGIVYVPPTSALSAAWSPSSRRITFGYNLSVNAGSVCPSWPIT